MRKLPRLDLDPNRPEYLIRLGVGYRLRSPDSALRRPVRPEARNCQIIICG